MSNGSNALAGLTERLGGLAYGGDYNPEQWPESVWAQDVALMREAAVNLVTVGVFSWALLEPEPGRYEFGWLDRVLDLLHGGGIAVDLATATASPPPWFSALHPQSLPVTADGVRLSPGSRQAYCPSSPEYRSAAAGLARALATRYREHPALVLWHVNNEYGCHTAHCFCEGSAEAFRRWLQARYGTLAALNEAWGTAFWSQHYGDWSHVSPPRRTPSFPNPTQQLDFWRFSSAELLDCFRAERDELRRITPQVPVTTNFMLPRFKALDYWAWAGEVDLVANDSYLLAEDPEAIELALAADLTRSLAGGRPWLLMEHSTSAVNWQPRNLAKEPGQLRRNSLGSLARGADGVLFFQWRASAAGAEKFHSAMVPHAGTQTKVWREVRALGRELRSLADVAGSTVRAEVAVLWDYASWWAGELDAHPLAELSHLGSVRAYYDPLWRAGYAVDFATPEADLSRYRLVLAPSLYLVSEQGAANLDRYVRGGGTLLVSFFSGIVDPDDHVRLGGYPGAFRAVLGLSVEEFFPLRERESIPLLPAGTAGTWSELVHPAGAQVHTRYGDGHLRGSPAITWHHHGEGTAWYVSTRPDPATLAGLVAEVGGAAGVRPVASAPPGVEVVQRDGPAGRWLFAINASAEPAEVGWEGQEVAVPAGEVAVRRSAGDPGQVPPDGVRVVR